MKKIFFILLSGLILSCSSDDSNTDSDENVNPDETVVISTYRIINSSGSEIVRSFENHKQISAHRNGSLSETYEYNANDLLIKFSKYFSDGVTVSEYTEFTYGANNEIATVKEWNSSSEDTNNMIITDNNYSINTKNDNYNLNFTLNQDQLVSKILIKNSSEQTIFEGDYIYDSNKNVINAAYVDHANTAGGDYEFNYNYASKNNPIYFVNKKNYKAYLYLYSKPSLFGVPITEIIRTFGKSVIETTEYPSFYPNTSQYFYEYNFNNNNYPVTGNLINVGSNEVTTEYEFTY